MEQTALRDEGIEPLLLTGSPRTRVPRANVGRGLELSSIEAPLANDVQLRGRENARLIETQELLRYTDTEHDGIVGIDRHLHASVEQLPYWVILKPRHPAQQNI